MSKSIRSLLGIENSISAKKINKLVKIDSDTIPGKSQEEIESFKKDIALFAKNNRIKQIRIFDPRELLKEDEFVSPRVEQVFGGSVGIGVKKADYKYGMFDYFENQNRVKETFFETLNKVMQNFA